MKPIFTQELINKTAQLLKDSQGIAKQAALVPGLQSQITQLTAEKTAAEQKFANLQTSLSGEFRKSAQRYVEIGALQQGQLDEFVAMIEKDPAQVIEVMGKFANQLSIREMGGGVGGKTAGLEDLDPIAKFSLSR